MPEAHDGKSWQINETFYKKIQTLNAFYHTNLISDGLFTLNIGRLKPLTSTSTAPNHLMTQAMFHM
ncbi:hypothetical protein EGK74_13115 [Neisseria weixii]|uniref:Uncharacterized protein n=1 Tax=Neisseria weixii TaxID=1853276 RepID=A0A3N4MJK0_9NEIS|nr:hypothetical protein CGZ65_09190 [Neisseria weixii]RPD83225.1 hypothetical protein EGK74_13115 [Neisseria weixii]